MCEGYVTQENTGHDHELDADDGPQVIIIGEDL
jgi:hypothetical protein